VRGTSGKPQLFIIRDGHCHPIATSEWTERHQYVASDITLVEDRVISEIPTGHILS
jgi:hypothetical protein